MMSNLVPTPMRADLMYDIEAHLGLSAEDVARLTIGEAIQRLKRLGDGGRHEALGVARKLASIVKKAGTSVKDAVHFLVFPSQKGGGPLGRVAVWRLLSRAKKARFVRTKGVLRYLQRLALGWGAARPTVLNNPLMDFVTRHEARADDDTPDVDEGWSGEGDAYE